MWNDQDFQDAISCISFVNCREEVEALKELLSRICTGKNKIGLWSRLTDLQREILKHPEYLPGKENA